MATKKVTVRQKMGRPTEYKQQFVKQAYHLALLGATNTDVARAADVDISTVERWIAKHPDFRGALKRGRYEADATVAKSLYRRAIGYSHKAVKIYADPKSGAEVRVPYIERYPPDTVAAIFWLKNRRPDLWRDKQDHDHTVIIVPPEERQRRLLELVETGQKRLKAG